MRPKPRACYTAQDLKLGQRFILEYRISETDVRRFAELSGDFNPLHFDGEYASRTIFKERITHGMLSVAKFSGIFGMDFPGLGALWQSQNVRFLGPVYIDRPYKAVAEVQDIREKTVLFATWVEDESGERLIEGEGVIYPIPEKVRRSLTGAELEDLMSAPQLSAAG